MGADPAWSVPGRAGTVRILEILDGSFLQELKIAPKAFTHIGMLL